MTMVVKNNMTAIRSLNVLNHNSNELAKQLQQVSTGMKINSAADDASAYAISERMRVNIRGLSAAYSNTQNANSMMKVAEGAISSTVDILKAFKEKALDAANDTNTDVDRAIIQNQLVQYMSQIDDNANVTFNGKYLLNGTMGSNIVANQHDAIVSFMSYLNDSNLPASDALDAAINYTSCGMFKDEKSLIDSFLADVKEHGLTACGIDLRNDDTGAITGQDANGDRPKTAESIVPETGNPYASSPSGSTIIRGLAVNWPDTGNDAMKAAIVSALDNEWLGNCMDLIDESYALNFQENGTSVRSMNVNFTDANDGTLAFVTSHFNGNGVTTGLDLTVNMHYYNNLDLSDHNGAVAGQPNQLYLDRTIAHEMTHALMSANINNFSNLPLYIKEGAAELVHGIDDYRKSKIEALAADTDTLRSVLEDSEHAEGDSAYAAGYMILRYLANKSADTDPEKHISFQIGTKANQAIRMGLADMRCESLGLKKGDGTTVSVVTQTKANSALTVVDRALDRAIKQQITVGAIQVRLNYAAANLNTAHENITASESTIRDADMAKTFTSYTRANVLMQTSQSMLAQANQSSSNVLGLLQ
ncbi:putative flagellin [Selenomonas ruminantium subsp. lactilytica TAM6421]|uniref:Flagellin n=2 Tax=Selenomonas ruminantium TaxID=971 RepID=I0GP89_SELRL|nr:putative flagellin [Selenomonas ruminantium subsp. lactilytica TAM6421]